MNNVNEFFNKIKARLIKGDKEYQGESFKASPEALKGEILEELEDVAGWAYILWRRLKDDNQSFVNYGKTDNPKCCRGCDFYAWNCCEQMEKCILDLTWGRCPKQGRFMLVRVDE
ncbi:MAG: hypothetical protein GY847_14500 [Proteobacteria bacterium]|nr:hypothetical protein [Pseudomonadota bacterium]